MARNENLLSISYNNGEEVEPDYLSTLPLGYRFCPTPWEIIVHYLIPKIETGTKHLEWRLFDVNIYDYHPDQLAELHWPFDKKWYFFTPRTRMNPNGDRPNRKTRDFGYWKTTQKDSTVCDDASGLEVGKKRCLVYFDASNKKSQWLMHEYTTMNPNIPVGSIEDKMKLTHWVLCEIYKKETDSEKQVLSASNQNLDELSRRQRITMHHQGSSYQNIFQQQVESTYQDYADSLHPGYRFCPTESEIIIYYLQPKIETGEQHPKCRYYIADFYGHTPDNLAANHRHCENKWYFLTPRDRKYPNGNRPNRRIKNFGFWRASAKCKVICDDVTGEVVGSLRSLAYYDEYNRKTPWLMHEYINNNPNITIGSRINERMKLSDWVLSEIYKKDENQNDNNNRAYQVEKMMNPEKLMEEDQNKLQDEPSPRRRRLSMNEYTTSVDLPMVVPMRFMCDSDQQLAIHPETLSGSSLIQPTIQDTSQGMNSMASTDVFQQAYNVYQDTERPRATLQSLPDQPMEWTEDDLSNIMMEMLDADNLSPRSSIDDLQETNKHYKDTPQPEVMLQSFTAEPTEWTQDDLEEIMENLDEDNSSPPSSTNVIQQAYSFFQDSEQPQVTLDSFLNQPEEEWTQDDLFKKAEEDNTSPCSLSNVRDQEFQDSLEDIEPPHVTLQGFSHQLVESLWSEDDFERDIMGTT